MRTEAPGRRALTIIAIAITSTIIMISITIANITLNIEVSKISSEKAHETSYGDLVDIADNFYAFAPIRQAASAINFVQP